MQKGLGWRSDSVVFPRQQEGWMAEWPWVAGWLHIEINAQHRELNPDKVAYLSANRALH